MVIAGDNTVGMVNNELWLIVIFGGSLEKNKGLEVPLKGA